MGRIDPSRWSARKDAHQLAEMFGCTVRHVYKYARNHKKRLRPLDRGRPTKKTRAPQLAKHKRIMVLYKTGEHRPAVIARQLKLGYHYVYRVIVKYKLWADNVKYIKPKAEDVKRQHDYDYDQGHEYFKKVGHTTGLFSTCKCNRGY